MEEAEHDKHEKGQERSGIQQGVTDKVTSMDNQYINLKTHEATGIHT